MYLRESIAQQGGWVAIKVVDKVDLLKTKEIGNHGCDPDQDSSETESNDNENQRCVEVQVFVLCIGLTCWGLTIFSMTFITTLKFPFPV